ncbi:MAG: (2Fe-2S)-binding protein [Candidatus Stahlbacteria bacterium]|nr:(2Fe-2S)-binding protein [Candidatus Stahlbacteria bacterium]
MITIRLNGVDVKVEEGWTVLEACKFYGIPIPTLCYNDGLSPYGACRLCIVEIGKPPDTKIVSSCTYPVEEGLIVHTHTKRVVETRKLLIELLVSICPTSKIIQDLASKYEVTKVRFKPKKENCVLCGLCTRMCEEQMQAKAIGFVNRGAKSKISTPFDMKSEVCRTCGACMYICPACQLRCQGPEAERVLCNSCLNISYPCVDVYEDVKCYMEPCAACLLEEAEKKKEGEGK